MYSLDVLYLNAVEIRKLGAFHHRCLQRIAEIPPSYVSRISNAVVRNTLQAKPLKHTLLRRQLLYFVFLAAKPVNHVLRDFVFAAGHYTLRPLAGPRKRGRPRANWSKYLYNISLQIAGDCDKFSSLWAGTPAAKTACKQEVNNHCNQFYM